MQAPAQAAPGRVPFTWRRLLPRPAALAVLTAGLVMGAVLTAGCRGMAPPPPPGGVVALLYHHLDPAAPTASSLSPDQFEAHLAWLKREGYQSLTAGQVSAYVSGEFVPARPSVFITFDDGYESVYTYAWPLLRKYGFSAAVFAITGRRGQTPGEFPHFSWVQACEMAASGSVEIHSHTHDMHHLVDGEPALEQATDLAVLADLLMSRVAVHDRVGTRAAAFSYPFGSFSPRTRTVVEQAGFDIAFTTQPGVIRPGLDPYLLPRNDVPAGTTIEGFLRLLGR